MFSMMESFAKVQKIFEKEDLFLKKINKNKAEVLLIEEPLLG